METHLAANDMAAGDRATIRLTTGQGNYLAVAAMTENLPYIEKYIEDRAENQK